MFSFFSIYVLYSTGLFVTSILSVTNEPKVLQLGSRYPLYLTLKQAGGVTRLTAPVYWYTANATLLNPNWWLPHSIWCHQMAWLGLRILQPANMTNVCVGCRHHPNILFCKRGSSLDLRLLNWISLFSQRIASRCKGIGRYWDFIEFPARGSPLIVRSAP